MKNKAYHSSKKNPLLLDNFNLYDTTRSQVSPNLPSFQPITTKNETTHQNFGAKTKNRFLYQARFNKNTEFIEDQIVKEPPKPLILIKSQNSLITPLDSKKIQNVKTNYEWKTAREPGMSIHFKRKETNSLLLHLETMDKGQKEPIKVLYNQNKNSMHLDFGKNKPNNRTKSLFNVYTDSEQRTSILKDLTHRLYYGRINKKKGRTMKTENPIHPILELVTTLDKRRTFISKNDVRIDNKLDFFLKNSNYHEHKNLLEDILKAVKSLQKEKKDKVCVKLIAQIVANSTRMLEALVDNQKEEIYDPLTPRSFFLRLNKIKSINEISSQKKEISPEFLSPSIEIPRLDRNFLKILMDFKLRLQEAGIVLQKERLNTIKNSILEEFIKILEKELLAIQNSRNCGNEKKYEKLKKDFKNKLRISNLLSGNNLSNNLEQLEKNYGNLECVNLLDKLALKDIESIILAIKKNQNQLIESLE